MKALDDARVLVLVVLVALGFQAPENPDRKTALEPEEVERVVEQASEAEATEIKGEEAALSERLRSILNAVDDFRGMRVEVEAGIVILSGAAPSREAAERAVEMAGKLEGVLLVVDGVRVEKGLWQRIGNSLDHAWKQGVALAASLPLFAVAFALFALFWFVARLLRDAKFLYRLASKRELLQTLLRQTVFVAVLIAGLVVALNFLEAGALIGTILGAAGVVGIALGFAFRNVVENYLAGILLAIRQPFGARDLVGIDGALGTVLRMTASETILMDADGNHLRIPNAMVFNGKVLNYTRNPMRRFQIAVGVATDVDLCRVQSLGVETLRRMKGVAEYPEPSSRIAALGDSSVQLEFFGWVDQNTAGYLKVASEAHRLLKTAFDDADIEMPAPIYLVHLDRMPAELQKGAPTPKKSRKAAAPKPPSEDIDVAPESDIQDQVEAEIARSGEENLLDENPRT